MCKCKNKIIELEDKLNNLVEEYHTGFLIHKSNTIAVKVKKHRYVYYPYNIGTYDTEVEEMRYYLKKEAPDCTYIKIDKNGKETLYKNDVQVNAKGICIK